MKLLLSFKACQASKLFYVWIHQNLDQFIARQIFTTYIIKILCIYYCCMKHLPVIENTTCAFLYALDTL